MIQTFFPYIGIGVFFVLSSKIGFLKEYREFLFIGLLLLVLKDIFITFVDLKPTKVKKLDNELMEKDLLGSFSKMIIWNRKKFFPLILVVYITQLLIKQTHILGLDKNAIFNIFNDNFLLSLVVISGILTIFKDNIEEKYEVETKSMNYSIFGIILTFCLAIIGAYIILLQTQKLGNLSFIISFISGVLIFLVGVLVIEDEEEEKS